MKKLFAQVVNLDSIIKDAIATFVTHVGAEVDPDGQLAFESRSELVGRVREALSKAEIAVSVREDGSVGAGVNMPDAYDWYKFCGKKRFGAVPCSFIAEFRSGNDQPLSATGHFEHSCIVVDLEEVGDGETLISFAVNKGVAPKLACGNHGRGMVKLNPFRLIVGYKGKGYQDLPDVIDLYSATANCSWVEPKHGEDVAECSDLITARFRVPTA